MSTNQRVAFIGLGIMGLPMAGHLLAAGHRLTVHTRTKAKAQSILDQGAVWADSPGEAVKGADFIFLCLPDTPDVEKVVAGLLAGIRGGQIIVDHSTISPAATRRMAGTLASVGVHLLDAPVSGGDVGARNATLSIMMGGDPRAFELALPLLQVMGKTITYTGPSGSGQLTKLTNQILVSLTNLATCEALTFAIQSGLDPAKTILAIGSGAGSSWQLNHLGPRMVAGDFAPGFMIDLQVKDLGLVADAMRDIKLSLPASPIVQSLFEKLQQTGHGRDGTQALFLAVQKNDF
ncbi:MAG TPA: NAD(P)-dependent oxidoreductase [Tepidisphaeraceae bacterium]|jgi:3-hydroxyisobutyrate dehydrogenase|nr:NAD(P)-dependent oxidoreductase [Tepidisphaeraceae bacterium]